jgi:hypothetical protein
MIEVDLPDGSIAEFPDGTSPDVMKRALQKRFGAPQTAEAPAEAERASSFQHPLGGAFNAATEGLHAGAMGGFDDEITAGVWSPFRAAGDWMQGEGFDIGRAYSEKQQELDAMKQQRREDHPIASVAGEVVGGLGVGAGASKAGLSLAGRTVPGLSKIAPRTAKVLPAAIEGAAYGGVYGAGESKPGERLEGAATGAAIGAATGGVVQGVGNAVATRATQKAVSATAPSADDLGNASQALYRASEAEGVRYQAPAIQGLGQRLKSAAGRINDRLRPKTAGFMDDVDNLFTSDMSLEEFDEFRKSLNMEIRRATPDDARTLGALKRTVDDFADNVSPQDFTGDGQKATALLKQARETWAKHKKTETIEKLLDFADVDGKGRYTQSGFANAIRQEMKKLYKSIKRGKDAGWSKEEVALIRQMAEGGSNSRIVNLFAKFAPRGVVSIGLGQAVGSLMPGVGNVAMPVIGHLAGEAADRGALNAAQTLRAGAATGRALGVAPQVTKKAGIAIPALASSSMGTGRSLGMSPRR